MATAGGTRSLEVTIADLIGDYEAKSARIGKLLHDEIGQILSGVGLQLEGLRLDLGPHPEAAATVAELQNMLEQAMEQVRAASTELNPSVVDRAGLHFALQRLIDKRKARVPGPVRMQFNPEIRLPRDIASAFYRVAEYAFDFALQGAADSAVDVIVKQSRAVVSMEIRGRGERAPLSEESEPLRRVGLLLLHRHAERAGIPVTIESGAGKGTIVKTSYRVAAGNS